MKTEPVTVGADATVQYMSGLLHLLQTRFLCGDSDYF